MARTIEEIIAIIEADIQELPDETEFDKGYRSGAQQTLFLLKFSTKDMKEVGNNG